MLCLLDCGLLAWEEPGEMAATRHQATSRSIVHLARLPQGSEGIPVNERQAKVGTGSLVVEEH